jgi:uncharacterized protein (DUF983 family)
MNDNTQNNKLSDSSLRFVTGGTGSRSGVCPLCGKTATFTDMQGARLKCSQCGKGFPESQLKSTI